MGIGMCPAYQLTGMVCTCCALSPMNTRYIEQAANWLILRMQFTSSLHKRVVEENTENKERKVGENKKSPLVLYYYNIN